MKSLFVFMPLHAACLLLVTCDSKPRTSASSSSTVATSSTSSTSAMSAPVAPGATATPSAATTPATEAIPATPQSPDEPMEEDPEYFPLKGCGMVTADDNQGTLDFRVVTTEKYCDQSTANMDLTFTALVDKQTKQYPVILVNAVLVDPVQTAYTTVRFTFREKTVERKATSKYLEKFCWSAGKCEHHQIVTFEVDRSVVLYWAAKGGVVRFGPGRKLKINPKEATDFLKTLTKLGAVEAGKP